MGVEINGSTRVTDRFYNGSTDDKLLIDFEEFFLFSLTTYKFPIKKIY